jgi:penicillin-insensitive murein DD-endopeptidase
MFEIPSARVAHSEFSMKLQLFLLHVLLGLSLSALGAAESTCYGTTANGLLKNGWQLPTSGENFQAYSLTGVTAGRNYVHSKVHRAVVDAYKDLEKTAQGRRFVYGESGWKEGGKFQPHKTHQNGLSVDFFVPVSNRNGVSATLPTNLLNKLGYAIEFDNRGRYGEYNIDYDAMAAHLLAIKRAADKQHIKIWRVIFDSEFQKQLFATKRGATLPTLINFSKKKPWVRHDEHYHIDFIVPCAALP